jgi:SEC-C motif-containing protein
MPHLVPRPLAQPFSQPVQPSRQLHRVVYCQSKGFGASTGAKTLSKQAACPCGSGEKYSSCCQKYHKGELPPTPEALMRSRYSAYSKGLVDYVCDTTHSDNPSQAGTVNPDDGTPSSSLREDVTATCDKITWDKLKILSCEDGSSPDEAYVTFQTWFKTKGQQGQRAQGWTTQSFVEKSRFLKGADGKWLYVDGEQDWKT